jgi:hypothetical protein
MRNAFKMLIGKAEERISNGDRAWDGILENVRGTCETVDWIRIAQDRAQKRGFINKKVNLWF